MRKSSGRAAQLDRLRDVIRRYWGYDGFLPLQREAMLCVLDHRDSVVVLPTGGGKSLCFQAPALCCEGLALVVSPLISLMKDQVDTLRNCGVPAACVNSTLSYQERREVATGIRNGQIRLLYIAPERLLTERTLSFLTSLEVSLIAVDEAHCISAWGHDFRPEYRALRALRERFPRVGIHAYTATATPRVRNDIAEQLALRDPEFVVGSFDRPNLIYRIQPRTQRLEQVRRVVERHAGESGVVYCISRKDVEQTCQQLIDAGIRAMPYHAGMDDLARRRSQDAFMEDRADTIVATVAFGMGIDKPNVRYVVHAGMPKSLESYQQESGRAGRDGLEAECCLFFSGRDYHTWKRILDDAEDGEGGLKSLGAMWNFCNSVICRHQALLEHFGQEPEGSSCGACDVCLGELNLVESSQPIAQKILSCVVRLNQQFGGDYVAKVLSGSKDAAILRRGHDRLSTWGLLAEENKQTIRDWIEQLVGQGFLSKSGDYHLLCVTEAGRQLLRGEVVPRLLRVAKSHRDRRAAAPHADSWEGVDRELFQLLRELRRAEAHERRLPPYMIFDDVALRDMARRRPTTLGAFHQVRGVGEKKLADFGEQFVACIARYCAAPGQQSDRSK